MIESVASAQVVAGFIQYVWLIPALPLLAFLVNGFFGRRWLGHLTGWIATGAVGLSALLAIGVFVDVLRDVERSTVVLYRWIGVGEFKIDVAAFIDTLSSVMLLVVTVVGTLIFVFANGYMAHGHGFTRFFTWFSLFVFAMLICLALFVGATGKSAQLPLYSWLPDAMEGPTPVSALIHAATMVTAGVYLVARSTPLFVAAGSALQVVAVIGALTAIFAATIALVQFH